MKPWKNDVNVLLIFFVRDDVFAKTFEAVREARPRRLLLWQDGAREGRQDDVEAVARCRRIAENIDWECEVYKNYQTQNWGCDPSTFYSHKWAFSIVDKCIVLEDDCLPMQGFFPYCKELLDRYEDDTRINRICGMNNIGCLESCPDDYFFTKVGSVWGWATWKRVADSWEEDYAFLNDEYSILQSGISDKYMNTVRSHAATGKPYWESVQTLRKYLNSSFDIVPKTNMIHSLGVSAESTHSVSDIRLVPKKFRKAFYEMECGEPKFPLRHPKYVVENQDYPRLLANVTANTLSTRIERYARLLVYGNKSDIWKKIKKRLGLE